MGHDARVPGAPIRLLANDFGAQHTLGDRFAIYGELGLAYERGTTEITTSELRRRAFGTRSGVGVVLYF